eukprot:2112765-Pyramimonas_sp.AAC.1
MGVPADDARRSLLPQTEHSHNKAREWMTELGPQHRSEKLRTETQWAQARKPSSGRTRSFLADIQTETGTDNGPRRSELTAWDDRSWALFRGSLPFPRRGRHGPVSLVGPRAGLGDVVPAAVEDAAGGV